MFVGFRRSLCSFDQLIVKSKNQPFFSSTLCSITNKIIMLIFSKKFGLETRATSAAVFGGSVLSSGRRFYGIPSLKKRERAKDFLCTMMADGLVNTGLWDVMSAQSYVRLVARPLMRYRRNFVWAPMFKLMYWPIIKKVLDPRLQMELMNSVGILGELRRVRDQVKFFRKFFGPLAFESPDSAKPTNYAKLVVAANMMFKRKGMKKIMTYSPDLLYSIVEGVWENWDWALHPMLIFLKQRLKIMNQDILLYRDAGRNIDKILDSRLFLFGKDELPKPRLTNLWFMGQAQLTAARLRSLAVNKLVLWLYFCVKIAFDRVNTLKWKFNINSWLTLVLEVSEAGFQFYSEGVEQGTHDNKSIFTRRFRPTVLRRLGKVWAFLPSNIGFVRKGRKNRFDILEEIAGKMISTPRWFNLNTEHGLDMSMADLLTQNYDYFMKDYVISDNLERQMEKMKPLLNTDFFLDKEKFRAFYNKFNLDFTPIQPVYKTNYSKKFVLVNYKPPDDPNIMKDLLFSAYVKMMTLRGK